MALQQVNGMDTHAESCLQGLWHVTYLCCNWPYILVYTRAYRTLQPSAPQFQYPAAPAADTPALFNVGHPVAPVSGVCAWLQAHSARLHASSHGCYNGKHAQRCTARCVCTIHTMHPSRLATTATESVASRQTAAAVASRQVVGSWRCPAQQAEVWRRCTRLAARS
jgi:hypothetical protein